MNVEKIAIGQIAQYPQQEEYHPNWESTIDEEFVNSIKTHGVLQTPLVCRSEDLFPELEQEFVCIAGHRRLAGAKTAGFTEVSCDVRKYENEDHAFAEFTITNLSRQETTAEKKKKFAALKKILNGYGKYLSDKALIGELGEPNIPLVRILTGDKAGSHNTKDIIAEAAGISKSQQEALTIINDSEYRQKTFGKWYKQGLDEDSAEVAKFNQLWQEIDDKHSDGELSDHAAKTAVKELIEGVSKIYPDKKKAKSKTKSKAKPNIKKIKKGILQQSKQSVEAAKYVYTLPCGAKAYLAANPGGPDCLLYEHPESNEVFEVDIKELDSLVKKQFSL
jgi:ParB-like chromosome segregation protein Spo0J